MEKTAVTAICWVPKGSCRAKPLPEGDGEEGEEEDMLPDDGEDGSAAAASSSAAPATVNMEGLDEFNLDKYDEEPDNDGGMQFFQTLNGDLPLLRERDPYLTGNPDSDSEDDGENEIRPEDNVFIATSCEEDSCNLEVYVFDEEEGEMYVHHDIMLNAYPLCAEWLSSTASGEGSFGVVGSIDHSIEIWDLDVLDAMEPIQTLGTAKKAKATKGKKKTKPKAAKAHDGAVMCLHGSPFNRSVLASGSADETLKIWDVAQNSVVHTYTHHTSKVQCVKWHPTEQAVLLSAAFDQKLALLDVRQPGQAATVGLPAEAESAIWSRHQPFCCFASADNGMVACYDVRRVVGKAPEEQKVLWSLQAHDVACTAVQDCPTKDLLVTSGLDGDAKVWTLAPKGGAAAEESKATTPSLVFSKSLQAGPLFSANASSEAAAFFCFGGKCPVMWDLSSEQLLVDAFGLEPAPAPAAA